MCRNYDELASDIVTHVGGEQNVKSLKHCVTRLLFALKDESKAETDYLKNRDGVVTVVFGLDQKSGLYLILNAAGDGMFQYLPLFLRITAARLALGDIVTGQKFIGLT